MEKVLKNILLITLVLIGVSSYGQNFKLIDPKKDDLREAYENDKDGNDIIYYYLIQNYKPVSEKNNIKKIDYGEFNICAFDQTFEYGIKFSTDSCQEAGGINMVLELPKISEETVKLWIEKIYDTDSSQIPNEWYKGKNTYGPVDEGAGCYYELKSGDNKWIINIYCGC